MAKAERVLDPAAVSNFFRAQIGANKLVRYSLLAEWRRVVKAPDHTPVNLAGVIRPELDEVGGGADLRIDGAVGKCVAAHKTGFDPFKAIAFGRAMEAACTSEQ